MPRFVIGLFIAVVLWMIGWHELAIVFVVASSVVFGASTAFPRFGRWLESTIKRVVAPVGRFTTTVLMAVVFYSLFVPVALALKLLRRDPLATATGPGTNWVVRHSPDTSVLARRQFTHELEIDRPVRRSRVKAVVRLAAITARIVAIILVLDLVAGTAYNFYADATGPADGRVTEPAFAGQEWVDDYFAEKNETDLNAEWQPLLGLVRGDYSGEYINIEDMARRTYQPAAVGPDTPTVFFFGGSTAFGMGQRDLYTIPSGIARLAEGDGMPVAITNYGQSGWVIWQELALLTQLLSEGNVPDVAIFYNGLNETGLQIQDLSVTPTYPRAEQIKEETSPRTFGSVLRDVVSEYAEHSLIFRTDVLAEEVPVSPDLIEQRATNAVALHARAVEVIEALADAYGFEPIFLWQPVVFTKDSGEESVWSQPSQNAGGFGDVYRRTLSLLEPPVIDISDSLDHITTPVYVDGAHTNEAGAEGVAQAIYPILREALATSDG